MARVVSHIARLGGALLLLIGSLTRPASSAPVIVTGPEAGGNPEVRVFDAATGALLASFFAFDPGFLGGARVGSVDANGDGIPDVVVAAGPGGGSHVRVFDGAALLAGSLVELTGFLAYDPGLSAGLFVAGGTPASTGTGDTITAVTAGPGLTGGGTAGEVTVSLISCPANGILKASGPGAWTCGTDQDAGGTLTAVTAGLGLSGGGSTGDVSLAINPAVVQQRVTGTCPPGQYVQAIDAAGLVTCGTDANSGGTLTSFTAGLGLTATPNPITTTGTLDVDFGGPGLATTVARSDHTHAVGVGANNTAVGQNALNAAVAGSGNTAVGASALAATTTGESNSAIGMLALRANTAGELNTASGAAALVENTTGNANTGTGAAALTLNTTGIGNTAIGFVALFNNSTGSNNTAIGRGADVASGNLTNAMALGANAVVGSDHSIRLGDTNIVLIEAQVPLTVTSDQTRKERFEPVDGEAVLRKLRALTLTSWNFIGHDPARFRHYGPMAQEFFAAFGHDGIGTIGTPTTLNAGDVAGILLSAVQALERRTAAPPATAAQAPTPMLLGELQRLQAVLGAQAQEIAELRSQNARLQERDAALAARLERLEATAARAATLASH
jgi:hypothetical protein